jgi:hypothetical protein
MEGMMDNPDIERIKATEITVEDVTTFFDKRKVRVTCELCDVTDWSFSVDYKVSYVPTVLATCRNCGNMRLHSQVPIQMWKLNEGENGNG